MGMKKKILCGIAVLLLMMAAVFGGYWAWKYYWLSPEPDAKEYATIEQRAKEALNYVRKHDMNERYALFVDYSIPSGTPRLFVWDFRKKRIVARTYVMHGPGGGSTDKRARFSNRIGSNCSSLGKFLVTKEHGRVNKRGFRLKGLEKCNSNAYVRALMIHRSSWVDTHCWMPYIPLHPSSCEGCVTVSSRGLDYLHPLIMREKKPLLLWSFSR